MKAHVFAGLILAALGTASSSAAAEKVTYLGAMTAPVPSVVSSQLGLPSGMGLTIVAVETNSPAAAVLKPDDILTRIDDQKLISPEQLNVLVKNYKPGDEPALTYLRAGKEATGKVKLIAAEPAAARPSIVHYDVAAPGRSAASADDRVRILSRAALVAGGSRGGGGGGDSFNYSFGRAGGSSMTTVSSRSDAAGTVEISIVDGHKSVIAKKPDGTLEFSGPFDTEEQRVLAPISVRARVEEMEKAIDVRTNAIRILAAPEAVRQK